MEITLKNDEAIKGDNPGGKYIQETGIYTGIFTQVIKTNAPSGAEFIQFSFKDKDEKEANYLSICVGKRDGTPNDFGIQQAQALMACMKVKSIATTPGQIKDKDNNTKNVEVYQDLVNKPIGLILRKSLYTKINGEDGNKMEMFMYFNPETKQTATELLTETNAKTINNFNIDNLADKDERQTTNQAPQAGNKPPVQAEPVADNFNDDIPF